MFHKEFYPTPPEVIQQMMHGVDLTNKTILDPSAGSGAILNYVSQLNGNEKYAYEVEGRLRSILTANKFILLGNDFLNAKKSDVSHIDLIVMNPPFSNAYKHILHAWDIAPGGCEIVALCNSETLRNGYMRGRRELNYIVNENGKSNELGKVFQNSERTTDVDVSLLRLFKPKSSGDFDYDMFFMDEEDEPINTQEGLLSYNEVRAVVNNYVASLREFEGIEERIKRINQIGKQLDVRKLECTFGSRETFISKHEYARRLQKQSWNQLFDKFNLKKYLTSKVNEKLDRFIAQQEKVPFTMKNIYVMMDMIFQTRGQNLNEALVDAVDHYTRYTHKNRFQVPGWKTNSGYMINEKFIVSNMIDCGFGTHYSISRFNQERFNDLRKVMCNLTGKDFDKTIRIYDYLKGKQQTGKWYDDEDFFEFKYFKKETMHLKFKDRKHWELLNRKYAEIKGQDLPEAI